METRLLKISADGLPTRLDKVIFHHHPQFSRRYIKRLIHRGSVFVDGKRVRKSSYQVVPPVIIQIYIKDNQDIENIGHQIHWSHLVVYQDDHLIALNKPAGIPTAPTRDSAIHNVYFFLQEAGLLPGHFFPFHRLDRDTSGVLLIPLSRGMAQALNDQMKKRQIHKTYLALSQGRASRTRWRVKGKISRQPEHPALFTFIPQPDSNKSHSYTDFRVLAQCFDPDICLIEAMPITGRTHQIRLHLRFSHLPILGDKKYNALPSPVFTEGASIPSRLMLHCREIRFLHPYIKDQITVQAPLPEDFRKILQLLFPEHFNNIDTK